MNFQDRLRSPGALIRIGAAFLLLANLLRWYIHPTGDFLQGFADGAIGTLFGLSFGCLLLGARLSRRQRRGDGGGPCATP